MTKRNTNNIMQKGSLMVEALALLGLITMVTPVMYKKAAERTTELQDINIATQMRTLNAALDSYVRNNFANLASIPENTKKILNANDASDTTVAGIKSYLPTGFDISQSKYFDANNLKFSIERKKITDLSGTEHHSYTSAVLAPALNNTKLNRASKIASMIGVNGGTIKGSKFEGTQGAWNADPNTWFGVAADTLKPGSLMSISNEAISEAAQADTSKLLYRVSDDDASKNTMETNLLFSNSVGIENLHHIFGNNNGTNNTLTIGNSDNDNLIVKGIQKITERLHIGDIANLDSTKALEVAGTSKFTGDLTVANGESSIFNVNSDGIDVTGTSNLTGNLTVTAEGTGATEGSTVQSKLEVKPEGFYVTAGESKFTGDLTVTQFATLQGGATIGTTTETCTPPDEGGTCTTTASGNLTVHGSTTLQGLTADATTLGSLIVNGTAEANGGLTVKGGLSSDSLHADNQLTVGKEGDNIGIYMISKSDLFEANAGTSSLSLEKDATSNEYEFNVNIGDNPIISSFDLSNNEANISVNNKSASLSVTSQSSGSSNQETSVALIENGSGFTSETNSTTTTTTTTDTTTGATTTTTTTKKPGSTKMKRDYGEIGITTSDNSGSVYLKSFIKNNNSADETGSLTIDSSALNLKHGTNYLKMDANEINIAHNNSTILKTGKFTGDPDVTTDDYFATTLKSPDNASDIILYNTKKVKLNDTAGDYDMPSISALSNTFYLDDKGLALGSGLKSSFGEKTGPDFGHNTDKNGTPGVILSREGYIWLPAPNDDPKVQLQNGNATGFIRARRLVSDIPYPTGADFHGNTATGGTLSDDQKYDYYQVNPAYTSIMNDIKLASRGGARLSDILSDYIIKGIYVADNTYHAGSSEYGYADSEDDLDRPLGGDLFGEGLYWEFIPIENGAVKSGTIREATNEDDNTICNEEGEGKCRIYECSSSNCVASPWLGFVPAPHCPRGYQAVITTSPIRWRMSEVFYLTKEADDWKNNENTPPENYNAILSDLNSMPYGGGEPGTYDPDHDSIKIRFNKYFHKANNPRLAHFEINEAPAVDGADHTHTTTSNPITFQTNTWLNSSVDPKVDEEGIAYGWHVLMGFLYRPGDFSELLDDMGYEPDNNAIYWNIFPVYAQEMASIATTYCAFIRNPGEYDTDGNLSFGSWNWKANDDTSPVLDYNQLNPATYRDPTLYSRNPKDSDRGEHWSKQVNDPSLPYDDAW